MSRRNANGAARVQAMRVDQATGKLGGMGLKAIHRALESGDAKVALAMFKGPGIFTP